MDKILGGRMAVMLGALLMVIGHVVLGASEIHPLFLYLSLVIIAYDCGLSKFNVSCLLGELYESIDPRRDDGFSLTYMTGSVESIIALIVCGLAQEKYSWAMGFGLAAVGVVAGLVIFLCGSRHLTHTHGVNKKVLRMANFLLPNWGRPLVLLVATPALITMLFWKEQSVYTLIITTIIGLEVLVKIYHKAENQKQCRELGLIVALTFFNMLFWAFI